MIKAQVVADSICNGHRITTMLVIMPRFILAEFNTHRMLSKNSASSRAIPFKKMVQAVMNDPFIPIAWQRDHTGMQVTESFTSGINDLIDNHLRARDAAVERATEAHERGATKQYCNRLLEPFMWHTVLCTATEFENFFHLRCPQYHWKGHVFRSKKDALNHREAISSMTDVDWLYLNKGQAEIHMMALAEAMWDARNESTPKELQPGQWHIPFGDNIREEGIHTILMADGVRGNYWGHKEVEDMKVKIAVARAARTSYTVVGDALVTGDSATVSSQLYLKDIELHDRLLASGHMSPFEHCAQAMTEDETHQFIKGHVDTVQKTANWKDYYPTKESLGWCHNLRGWKSYRSMIPNENRR